MWGPVGHIHKQTSLIIPNSEDLLELFSRLFGSSSSSPRGNGGSSGARTRSGSDGGVDMGEVDESYVEDIDSGDYYSGGSNSSSNDRSTNNISMNKGNVGNANNSFTNNSAFVREIR